MALRPLFVLTILAGASLPLLASAKTVRLGVVSLDGSGVSGATPAQNVTAEEIEKTQAPSLASALGGVAGVAVQRMDNPNNASVTLRGFGGSSMVSSDPNVRLSLDGASAEAGANYRNSGAMAIDPALLRNLSVKKGPLAALPQGSGLLGGVIEAETINGADLTQDQIGARFRQLLGANSNGEGWVTSSTLGWKPSDRVDFLLNYTRRAQDEQKDGNGTRHGATAFNLPSYLLKARVKLADGHSVTFSYVDAKTSEKGVNFYSIGAAGSFGLFDREKSGQTSSLAYNWNPSDNPLIDLELKYTASRQHLGLYVRPDSNPIFGRSFAGEYDLDSDSLGLTNTARFQSGGISHSLRAGIQWERVNRDRMIAGLLPSGKDDRIGVFALDEMDFGNELTVTAGLRFDRQSLTGVNYGSGRGPAILNDAEFDHKGHTLGLGFEKGLGEGFHAFGSVAVGEGLPPLDAGRLTVAATGESMIAQTRKFRAYEIGTRYEGADLWGAGDRLSLSASIYHNDTRRPHVLNFASSSNVSRIKDYGLELQADYETQQGYYAKGALTLVHNKQLAADWDLRDFTPADSASLTLGRRFQNGFDASWRLRAAGSAWDNNSPSTPVKVAGYGVHDLGLSYTAAFGVFAGATLNLGVENLFDRQYRSNLTTLPEAGRNVKISLSKTF